MTAFEPYPSAEQLRQWRHDFHQNPEIAFEEHRTSARIAELLREAGLDVHTGLAGTGVVATLDGARGPGRTVGLRADIDALAIEEATDLDYASQTPGRMHACGHDGHTTMLLGAAWALARDPDFAGRVHFIFQPAEENEGGARVMIEQGLFDLFPMDAVYGLHNWPGMPVGEAAVHSGPSMAAFDVFTLRLSGRGCHAAMPHMGDDVVLAGCELVTRLQGLISRERPAHQPAVLSVTQFHGGDAFNVMPSTVELRGTLRCFDPALREHLEKRFREAVQAGADFHGLAVELDYQSRYPATINDAEQAARCASVLEDMPEIEKVHYDLPPCMASEDFAFMLEKCPGAYIWMGNGDSAALHNPAYDFNDALAPLGVAWWQALVRQLLS
ncbi:M20 aminoacylase family protein [Kushneria sp. TE3]|uniref:M20 aminoacylase family protein n=1 Tax=Kushneria sp. TE3 TaxID=3449832 RepID=UPI003F68889D